MNKPIVLFDVDGFLLDFITPALAVADKVVARKRDGWLHPLKRFARFVRGEQPQRFKINDFPSWDIFDTIGREHEPDCYIEYEKPGFCASFEPYPGAVEGVREARKMADVVIVTSPLHSPTWCHERVESLKRHFDIPRDHVIFAKRKTLVVGRMLVDDNPEHVREWGAEHYPRGMGVVWDQPYNRSAASGMNMYRCDVWEGGRTGLLSIIEQLARDPGSYMDRRRQS